MSPALFAVLFRQLRFSAFLRAGLVEAVRRLADRWRRPSYAQAGEDILIERLVGWDSPERRYVDVGCHHPIHLSNTYLLYLRGWTGVGIDANGEFAEPFRRCRPRDTFVNACVSDVEGEATFRIYKDRALSGVTTQQFAAAESYELEREVLVPTRRLDTLLAAQDWPRDFDLLTIDVEGHDLEVLRSIDLAAYRPRVIVVEAHGIDPGRVEASAVHAHLVPFGYAVVAFHENNLFFRRTAEP